VTGVSYQILEACRPKYVPLFVEVYSGGQPSIVCCAPGNELNWGGTQLNPNPSGSPGTASLARTVLGVDSSASDAELALVRQGTLPSPKLVRWLLDTRESQHGELDRGSTGFSRVLKDPGLRLPTSWPVLVL
jgi:hypothetical protein